MMNKKGFTLVELLATLVVLAIIMSIGAYSIIQIFNSSKKKNYEILLANIKSGAETYYQECKYANNSGITCTKSGSGYTITLGNLTTYGYLKGNSTDSNKKYTIVNPNNNKNIASCQIKVENTTSGIKVTAITTTGSCPKQEDYDK